MVLEEAEWLNHAFSMSTNGELLRKESSFSGVFISRQFVLLRFVYHRDFWVAGDKKRIPLHYASPKEHRPYETISR